MSMGCPECGRTPVVFVLSQKMWFCRSCKNTWREEDGKPEPVYVVAENAVKKAAESKKARAARAAGAPKKRGSRAT